MSDDIPEIVIMPEVQAGIDSDPELASAMREISSVMRNAMQGVRDGRYASFNDAMEALTGERPQPVLDGESDEDEEC